MDSGEFSVAIRAQLPRFNGKLFKQPDVLPLTKAQIDLLIDRRDDVINICEMKFTDDEFVIDKEYVGHNLPSGL